MEKRKPRYQEKQSEYFYFKYPVEPKMPKIYSLQCQGYIWGWTLHILLNQDNKSSYVGWSACVDGRTRQSGSCFLKIIYFIFVLSYFTNEFRKAMLCQEMLGGGCCVGCFLFILFSCTWKCILNMVSCTWKCILNMVSCTWKCILNKFVFVIEIWKLPLLLSNSHPSL